MCCAQLSPLLASYEQVILDLDGTVWVGDSVTPGAPEAIAALRAAGIRLAYVTNNSSRSPEEFVQALWAQGCTAAVEEIVSVGAALQFVLAQREPGRAVYVIGAEAVARHVLDAGHRVANHVSPEVGVDLVVAAAHPDFNYTQLLQASRAVAAGAELICLGRDRSYPAAQGLKPGTGAVVAALEYSTGVQARNIGKPDPQIFEVAIDRLGTGRTLMVGDHVESDLGGAAAAGLDAALVLTGVTDAAAAQSARDPAPVGVAESLAALVLSS